MNQKTARALIALGVPVLAASFGYLPFVLMKSQLPDPLASHFTSSGVPDGSMSPNAFLAVTSVMFVIGALLCIAVGVRARPIAGANGVGLAATGGFLSAFASGLLLETVLTQRGLDSWTEASFSWPLILLAALLGLGVAAIAARVASSLPSLSPDLSSGERPMMELGEGEQAVWSGSLRSTALTALGVASMLFTGFLALATSNWMTVGIALLGSVAMLSIASVKVQVGRSGLHVRYGLLPWPRTSVALDEIESASVIEVEPKQWGGWGYRGSLAIMKQAAVVLRKGPGIRLDLHNGKVFVVTIDNPDPAVGLLNAQVQRVSVPS